MTTPESSFSDYALPRVSTEIGDSLFADAKDGLSVIKQADERLRSNNPDLYRMLATFIQAAGCTTSGEITAAHDAMVLTHELLRRQAETDALNSAVAPDNPDS